MISDELLTNKWPLTSALIPQSRQGGKNPMFVFLGIWTSLRWCEMRMIPSWPKDLIWWVTKTYMKMDDAALLPLTLLKWSQIICCHPGHSISFGACRVCKVVTGRWWVVVSSSRSDNPPPHLLSGHFSHFLVSNNKLKPNCLDKWTLEHTSVAGCSEVRVLASFHVVHLYMKSSVWGLQFACQTDVDVGTSLDALVLMNGSFC